METGDKQQLHDRAVHFAASIMDHDPKTLETSNTLGSGLTHLLIMVKFAGHPKVIVRVNALASDRARTKSAQEVRFLSLGLPFTPTFYGWRAHSQWFIEPALCLEYVEGTHLAASDISPGGIEELARQLSALHAVDPLRIAATPPSKATLSDQTDANALTTYAANLFHEQIIDKLDVLQRSGSDVARSIISLIERMQPLVHGLDEQSRENASTIHGDLNAMNILWRGNAPTLIDWEHVRAGDPAEDIAYLFTEGGFADAQFCSFWAAYESRDKQTLLDRVRSWKPLVLFLLAGWWTVRSVGATDQMSTPSQVSQRECLDLAAGRLAACVAELDASHCEPAFRNTIPEAAPEPLVLKQSEELCKDFRLLRLQRARRE